MEENKIIAYSFLAYLNNDTRGNGFNDIFIPLVKRVLSKLSNENQLMGQISDIKEEFEKTYKLDVPYPMLIELLKSISIETNKGKKGKMILNNDKSFCIEKYTFDDYEETISFRKSKIQKLEMEFKKYIENNATISQYEDDLNLFEFIDRNRMKLSVFLTDISDNIGSISKNADIEMEFINYIKNNDVEMYNTLKDIYIGSIISTYFEIDKINTKDEKVRFIVDTNFIISLMELHSIEYKDTCDKIVDICKKIGYKISIADITIEEVEHILSKIIEGKDNDILEKFSYNSTQYICEKNNITKTDLINKKRKLKEFLTQKGISIIYLKSKYRDIRKIKNSELYKKMQTINYADKKSILHDAILIDYVSNERPKSGRNFAEMKCWFLTESKKFNAIKTIHKYPEAITTNELVNLLWLIRPTISSEAIFKLGLNSLLAEVVESRQPSRKTIREIDDNIKKYKDSINDDDIIALGTIISDSSINILKDKNKEYEEVNELLRKGEFDEFSDKIKRMKLEQEEAKEAKRILELKQMEERHEKEKNNEFTNFISVLIENNIKEYNEENNNLEYRKLEISSQITEHSNKIKKAINWSLTIIILLIATILTVWKNLTENKITINIIDITLIAVPVLCVGIFNFLIIKFAKEFERIINKKRHQQIDTMLTNVQNNESAIIQLSSIRQIILESDKPKDKIKELLLDENGKSIIEELKLEEFIKETII